MKNDYNDSRAEKDNSKPTGKKLNKEKTSGKLPVTKQLLQKLQKIRSKDPNIYPLW